MQCQKTDLIYHLFNRTLTESPGYTPETTPDQLIDQSIKTKSFLFHRSNTINPQQPNGPSAAVKYNHRGSSVQHRGDEHEMYRVVLLPITHRPFGAAPSARREPG